MKKEKSKSEKTNKKSFIKAISNFHCGLSNAQKLEQFKRGFFSKS